MVSLTLFNGLDPSNLSSDSVDKFGIFIFCCIIYFMLYVNFNVKIAICSEEASLKRNNPQAQTSQSPRFMYTVRTLHNVPPGILKYVVSKPNHFNTFEHTLTQLFCRVYFKGDHTQPEKYVGRSLQQWIVIFRPYKTMCSI